MIGYGLRNFRRLEAIRPIKLKPVTILVGKNSSGKSSYLRSLSLLKQSISPTTAGAILWWGELVDFGSYEATRRKGAKEGPIGFDFEIPQLDLHSFRFFVPYIGADSFTRNISSFTIRDIKLNISISQESDSPTFVSKIELGFSNALFLVSFSSSGEISDLKLNGETLPRAISQFSVNWSGSSIFGMMYRSDQSGVNYRDRKPFSFDPDVQLQTFISHNKEFMNEAISNDHIDDESYLFSLLYYTLTRDLGFTAAPDSDGQYLLNSVSAEQYERLVQYIGGEKLLNLCLLSIFPHIYNSVSVFLRTFIEMVSYIGPARARSERYYRKQDLSVSTIAPDGTNFPMWLSSLSDAQVAEFSKLTMKLCGYGVRPARESGHISIILNGPGGFDINLIDAGYGLSQILPVLGQMWAITSRPKSDRPYALVNSEQIIAIEQPELHLHPAHQTTLAEAFADFCQSDKGKRRSKVKFLIETHSADLINRFGSLVYERKIRKEDIQIVIFNDINNNQSNDVEISTFDDSGALINWPYGFFSR